MARIIYVEDEPVWLDITRQALDGHQIDSARTFAEAVALIRVNEYDLALVDLNLGDRDDLLGTEVLDLLRLEHPSTRLIVVTAHPPSGGLKANILERYRVDEVILKAATTVPDLRRIVTAVLRSPPPAAVPADVKVARSELMQRYLDWRGHMERLIGIRTREATERAGRPGRKRSATDGGTEAEPSRWLRLREEFVEVSSTFERALSEAAEITDIAVSAEQLDRIMDDFAGRC